jgi:hypothetical protein
MSIKLVMTHYFVKALGVRTGPGSQHRCGRLPAAVAVGYGSEALVVPVAGAFLNAAHLAGITLHDILRIENARLPREADCQSPAHS